MTQLKSVSSSSSARASTGTAPRWAEVIAGAFEQAFLPQQSNILDLDVKSLVFAREGGNGPVTFNGIASRSAGGFAGNVSLGTVQVSGELDPATGKVTFTQPKSNSGEGVAGL